LLVRSLRRAHNLYRTATSRLRLETK
jgi:hypothetical protein